MFLCCSKLLEFEPNKRLLVVWFVPKEDGGEKGGECGCVGWLSEEGVGVAGVIAPRCTMTERGRMRTRTKVKMCYWEMERERENERVIMKEKRERQREREKKNYTDFLNLKSKVFLMYMFFLQLHCHVRAFWFHHPADIFCCFVSFFCISACSFFQLLLIACLPVVGGSHLQLHILNQCTWSQKRQSN